MSTARSASKFSSFAWVATACFAICFSSSAADAPKPEEIFPDSTLFAIAIPDLESARNAASNSRLGEAFKQPDVHMFIDPIVARISAAYAECRVAEPRLPAQDELDKALFTGEVSFCVYSRGGKAAPGMIFSLKPKDSAGFERLLTPFFNGQPLPKDQILPLGGSEEAPGALYSQGRLLVCSPATDMEQVSARIADAQKRAAGTLAASPMFKASRAAVGNSQAWLFLNPALVIDSVDALARNERPSPKAVCNALGLDKLGGIMLGLDFSNGEPVAQFFMGLNGAPGGALSLLATKGVSKDAFQVVAEDTPYVMAGSFHFARLIPAIREITGAIDPAVLHQLDMALVRFSETVHFDLQKDLLENIEPDVAYTQTRFESGAPLSFGPGMVGAMRVKNSAKVESALKQSFKAATQMLPPQMPEFLLRIASTSYNGSTLYYISQPINGSFCMTVHKDRLVWGNSVNAVKRGIDQLSAPSNILSNKSFQAALARVSGKSFDAENLPVSLSYSAENASGNGALMLAILGLGAETASVAMLAETLQGPRRLQQDFGTPPYLRDITARAGGRTALSVINAADLNLWPDETYFAKYRLAHASIGIFGENGWSSRTELPPPMPNYGFSAGMPVAFVAVVSAIAIPNLLRSRMAANETAAVAACKAYCTSQDIYRRTDYNQDGVLEYAQALKGANSLYETAPGLGDVALIDRSFSNAESGSANAIPKAGYYFKILTKEGGKRPRSYILNGRMTLGYAFLAYPAQYDAVGRNTFIVNMAGTIYQKDLGPDTVAIAQKITEFNPDDTWVIAE